MTKQTNAGPEGMPRPALGSKWDRYFDGKFTDVIEVTAVDATGASFKHANGDRNSGSFAAFRPGGNGGFEYRPHIQAAPAAKAPEPGLLHDAVHKEGPGRVAKSVKAEPRRHDFSDPYCSTSAGRVCKACGKSQGADDGRVRVCTPDPDWRPRMERHIATQMGPDGVLYQPPQQPGPYAIRPAGSTGRQSRPLVAGGMFSAKEER